MIAGWGPADRRGLEPLDGGVTAPAGFQAGGVVSGVKPSGRPDLALVVADQAATVAVLTTTNRVKASSCTWTEQQAADGQARAVVVNSGNANVCTPDGPVHTQRLATATGQVLGLPPSDVLVMSTGIIGEVLPIERIEEAMPKLVTDLSPDGGRRAAEAILTTDTRTKEVAYRVTDASGTCTVAGMAKGVGMIEPAMATLLVVLTTDAPSEAPDLQRTLQEAVATTFNRITIDGDGSTSDSIVLLASGVEPAPPAADTFARAVHAVCAELAHMVVADGEGATRVAAITVGGAPDEVAAERLARAIATSLLVRAAIHGADPNWGRILMAMGSAAVAFEPGRVTVSCAGTVVCRNGVAAPFDRAAVATAMAQPEITIAVDLAAGDAEATVLTCDLTPEYVRFNADYTT